MRNYEDLFELAKKELTGKSLEDFLEVTEAFDAFLDDVINQYISQNERKIPKDVFWFEFQKGYKVPYDTQKWLLELNFGINERKRKGTQVWAQFYLDRLIVPQKVLKLFK